MANTAMSDSGAIPSPTVWTRPCLPLAARPSRTGVRAASRGVFPSSSGMGSSPSPSRQTYRSWFTATPLSVLTGEGELLGVQAGPADQGAVDLGVSHEIPDVPRLDAAPVLDPDPGPGPFPEHRSHGPADQSDHLTGVGGLGVPPGPDGPDRLVGDHHRSGPLGRESPERRPDLPDHLVLRAPGIALLQTLPHAQDRDHVLREHRPDLLGDGLVRFPEVRSALRVPHDDVSTLQCGQHRRGDLARERALLLPVDVLSSQSVGKPVPLQEDLDAAEGREGGAHDHLDVLRVLPVQQVGELLDGLDGLQVRLVHLPVGRDDRPAAGLRHQAFSMRTATPGSSRPSRNSSEAPPPVDRWSTASTRSNLRSAARLSPPPTTVYPPHPATARATPLVPAEKGSSSKTPIGPFHRAVLASAMVRANSSTVRGPMSRPLRSRGMASAGTVCPFTSSEGSGATTTSSGSWISTPSASAVATARRTSSYRSGSTRDLPTSPPAAARNENAMAPPTNRASTLGTSEFTAPSLSDTLAPPRMATRGSAAPSRSLESTSTSFCMSRPATEGSRSATATTDA